MRNRELSPSSFNDFLTVLDPDRDKAGLRYEELRVRIVKFFEWRACRFPDALADETLDRVMRKIAAGESIEDHAGYCYGVARFVYLEDMKQRAKEQAVIIQMPVHDSVAEEAYEDERLNCLEQCLKKLTETSRSMILQYYRDERQAKIDHRKRIAERFNISVNALRIKTLRIRTTLEECVLKCLEKTSA